MKKKLLPLLALAFSMASSTWALDQVNGVYQIGSAQDLRDFATTVNGGEYGAFAVLTTNIDLNNEAWTSPIGSESHPYTGTFDGQSFTISNFKYTTTANNTGFFGNLGNGAVVKNFTIEGSINSTHQRVGVIGSVGSSSSVSTDITSISNIHSKINLTCTQTRHGGILGAQNGLGTINIDRCTYSGTFTANNISGNFGGIVGLSNNNSGSTINITNCLFDGEINIGTGDNAGGFVGYTRGCKLTIKNCLSNGTIQATNPGQFIGQINTTCRQKYDGVNYYVTGNTLGSTGGSAATEGGTAPATATSAQLASGEICYLLNGNTNGTNWYQTKGADNYPVPSSTSKRIYYKTSTSAYINIDGPVQIGSETDLNDFSIMVNHGGFDLDAELTDDINMASIASTWIPIGNWGQGGNGVSSAAYKGHFNGQGHEISNFNVTTSQTYYGIFGVVSAATIENFSIRGTITNTDYTNIGVIGYSRDTEVNIRNIQSYLTITNNGNDKNAGGILGSGNAGTTNVDRCAFFGTINAVDKTNAGGIVGYFANGSTSIVNIANCLFDGTITSETSTSNCGGIAGYGGANVNGVKIKNCLSIGTITATKKGQLFGGIMNSGSSITNCYYQGDNINGTGSSTLTTLEATVVTNEQLASGEVCYMLNGDQTAIAWYQTIGTDANPILDSTHGQVYVNGTVCPNGTPQGSVSYSNTEGTTIGSHNNVDGFCTYCGTLDETYMTPVNGYYEIGTPAQLKWLAAYVNAGHPAVNAKLTPSNANIDLTGVTVQPIGNADIIYTGEFDGQNCSISNYNYEATSNFNGLFGHIGGTAIVKDFSIDGTLTSTYAQNGVVGQADGTSVVSGIHSSLEINVSNCSSHTGGIVGGNAVNCRPVVESCEYSGKMTHTGTGDCQAGILGYTYWGTVRNCIFSGEINGEGSKYGGIMAYCRIASFGGIQNCLSIGKIVASNGNTTAAAIIANYNGDATTNVKNNYYKLKDGSTTTIAIGNKASNCETPHNITTEGLNLASGEVCAKLGYAFHQNIGSDATPTLDKTKGYVTEIKAAGWSTQYITDSDVTIPSGIEAFAGIANSSSITLDPITGAIAAEEPVVLRGAAGLYNFMPTTGATAANENDLKGSDGTVTGGTGIYALAKKNNKVGFYPVASNVTIPAGKAYLDTNSEVKAFTFVFGDDATGIEANGQWSMVNDGPIYNLAGQRLQKMQKGINIVNGKKIMY